MSSRNPTYKHLCTILTKLLTKISSTFNERIIFHEARQEIGESIIGWYARIKKLAVNCKFGANLASVLQDRFVIGMTKGKIVDRHCKEDPMVKNLQPLVDVAVTKEAAIQLSTTSMVKREVFQLKKKQGKSQSEEDRKKCFAFFSGLALTGNSSKLSISCSH